MVAPFFPVEAEKRYLASATLVGLVIAAFPLTVMVCAPLWTFVTARLGRLAVYCIGQVLLSLGTMAFPFAPTIEGCFAARVVQVFVWRSRCLLAAFSKQRALCYPVSPANDASEQIVL